ncbi:MAG: hydroxyacylglutathione hydrolase [Gammaproteobacteria bacterium]|nr:MAG: hydroxyacylglutathione hydrolase [Gammaproteobacteria bacterium]TND02144.1 MAG: hydroxyacylglutathione hydrolase [Gammaproteobacteria bacterium]
MINAIAVPAFRDNYIWLVHDAANRTVIVDPGDAQPVLAALAHHALTPVAVLITHHHHDHTGGIGDILARYPVPVLGPARESIPAVTRRLSDGERICVPSTSMEFTVLDVPGHTAGHIAFFGHNTLLCGDTLFAGGCGRLFEGTPEQMYCSLQKIARLPETTQVYCAHEYTEDNLRFAAAVEPDNADLRTRIAAVNRLRRNNLPTIPSTIGEEKRTNPFLRCDEPDVRAAARAFADTPPESADQVFAALRSRKDWF